MINILLERIKYLENRLKEIEKNNESVKENLIKLFKECKIEKTKKEQFKEELKKSLLKLNIGVNNYFFNELGLRKSAFIKIVKEIENSYLVIIDANFNEDIQKFIIGYMTNKISPFFTLEDNLIIGIINEKELNELKKLKTLSYYNPLTNEFIDIDIYKMFFQKDEFNLKDIEKAKLIFKEFRKRPSYKNKHFIEYSLSKNKITDFEKEKLNKEKEKYSFIYNETYANLEPKLKKEIENTPFVLAVLERIDKEIEKIKESKAIVNIVNRMLNFIELNFKESEIKESIEYLRNKLK